MKYGVKQKLFMYDTFVQHSSWRKCNTEFHRKFPDSIVQHEAVIHNIITKLCFMGSVLEKIMSQKDILTEENFEDISIQLEASLKKPLYLLVLQCELAKCTAQNGTKLLKLWPYKTAVLHIGFEVLTAVVMKSMKQVACRAGFLLGLFFSPEDGSDMFLRNVN
jgi:hypothetical protein